MVAFAKCTYDHMPYAVKFFASRARFDAENAIQRNHRLQGIALSAVCMHDPLQVDPGDMLVDACGCPLPPCMVWERGESLAAWSRRAKPDVFSTATVRPRGLHSPNSAATSPARHCK